MRGGVSKKRGVSRRVRVRVNERRGVRMRVKMSERGK